MNLGAKNDSEKEYNIEKMKQDVNPKVLDNTTIQNMVLRQLSDVFNWIDNRGTPGDNIPKKELDGFHGAILDKNATRAMTHACNILETKMHPTARDIITSPVKQAIYNLCGKRAFKYQEGN